MRICMHNPPDDDTPCKLEHPEMSMMVERCRCGNCKSGMRTTYFRTGVKTTESYCEKRRWYNFWKHDKKMLLTFNHIDCFSE